MKNARSIVNSIMTCLKIGTHNGTFHCDEVLACYMLRQLPEYVNSEIIRSRDSKVLETCDIVVDVGGKYDHSKKLYDHHQREFTETIATLRPDYISKVKLSSAGLVFHHYGERVMESILKQSLDQNVCKHMFRFVYEKFVKEIDAIDNGVPMYEVGEPLYQYNTNLSSRVGKLHPRWNDRNDSEENWMRLFEEATKMVGAEFEAVIHEFMDSWWPARILVEEAVDKRYSVHPSGSIIEVPLCPWLQHAFDIELEQNIVGTIKYAIFDDGTSWRVRAVPLSAGNFVSRAPLHPSWQGLRDDALTAQCGASDAIFVHATGFIGGAGSRAGVLTMAEGSLNYYSNQGTQV